LVDFHYSSVYNFLRRFTGHDHDASDLTQRTFARAWVSLESFSGRSTVSSWLHELPGTPTWTGGGHRPPWINPQSGGNCRLPTANPDETAAASDLATSIYAAVETSNRRSRHSASLLQDLSLAETAEALDVATSTSNIAFARRSIAFNHLNERRLSTRLSSMNPTPIEIETLLRGAPRSTSGRLARTIAPRHSSDPEARPGCRCRRQELCWPGGRACSSVLDFVGCHVAISFANSVYTTAPRRVENLGTDRAIH